MLVVVRLDAVGGEVMVASGEKTRKSATRRMRLGCSGVAWYSLEGMSEPCLEAVALQLCAPPLAAVCEQRALCVRQT